VLALDTPGQVNPAGAGVRLALFDVDNENLDGRPDEVFDEFDLDAFQATLSPDASNVGALDYGRMDLNGDGFTGGDGMARFDLDISDVNAAGTMYGEIEAEIRGQTRTFDEDLLTDLDILCYYAFSPLYTGSPDARETLTADLCGGRSRIAFSSVRDGKSNIYTMDPDGLNVERVTTNGVFDRDPSWSPGGARIVFVSYRDENQDIYVIDANGENEQRLTDNAADDSEPDWSPDGSQILFTSTRDGQQDIFVMKPDGTDVKNLTSGKPHGRYRGKWSPDGSKIVYACTIVKAVPQEICVMDSNGSNSQQVTDNLFFDLDPAWSPDGTKIVFSSNRADHPTSGTFEIYVMDYPGGSNQKPLTDNDVQDFSPAWSPDGTQIALSTSQLFNIAIMNADGSGLTNLTNNPAPHEGNPDWSP
jgi:Tol biopolymer transport system component